MSQNLSRGSDTLVQTVADALARRRRLALGYHNRASDERTEREVSPQRLIHYRDNWYLDAWCHLRRGLRTFALEAIDHARDTGREAREIDTQTLDTHYRSAYGIFAGRPEQQAVLRFSAVRARWVSAEQWHPEQHGQWLADGSYQLTLPYSRPHELTMDILRYGPDVEVIAPAPLRRQIAQRLRQAAALYA